MWAYVRANRVRFALLSAAGVGAATAYVYGRRYYRAIQEVWALEREAGTRTMRAKYVANTYVTEAAAAALLPLIRHRIPTPKALVLALRSGSIKQDTKVRTWEQVRDTTLVMLAAAAAATAAVYVALALATNLSREEQLLDVIRDRIINQAIDHSVTCFEERALVLGKSLPLKKKVSKDHLRNMITQMLDDDRIKLFDDNWIFSSDSDTANGNGDVHDIGSSDDEQPIVVKDRLNECLDLANTLEYRETALDAAHHVLDSMLDNVKPEEWNKPCAHLLTSIQQAANQALNHLPVSLRTLPSVEKLGVAVFLSIGRTSTAPNENLLAT